MGKPRKKSGDRPTPWVALAVKRETHRRAVRLAGQMQAETDRRCTMDGVMSAAVDALERERKGKG